MLEYYPFPACDWPLLKSVAPILMFLINTTEESIDSRPLSQKRTQRLWNFNKYITYFMFDCIDFKLKISYHFILWK